MTSLPISSVVQKLKLFKFIEKNDNAKVRVTTKFKEVIQKCLPACGLCKEEKPGEDLERMGIIVKEEHHEPLESALEYVMGDNIELSR